MMTITFSKRLQDIYQTRFKLYDDERHADVEAALLALLDAANGIEEKISTLGALVDHYHFIEDDSRALKTLREITVLYPNQVDGWLGLAEHFHYYDVDLRLAAESIEIALERALIEHCQVRQVLGVRIRISLAQQNFRKIEESLKKLVEYRVPIGSVDVALEHDFLPQIPAHAVDTAILQQYKSLLGLVSPSPAKSDIKDS